MKHPKALSLVFFIVAFSLVIVLGTPLSPIASLFMENPDMETICDNGIDDDNDGYIDLEDDDCIPEICDNGIDDDNDGYIDLEDDECLFPEEICDNGADDDGDGFIDLEDDECWEYGYSDV